MVHNAEKEIGTNVGGSPAERRNELLSKGDSTGSRTSQTDKSGVINEVKPQSVFERYADTKREEGNDGGLDRQRSSWEQFCEWMGEQGHDNLSDLNEYFAGRYHDWINSHNKYDQKNITRSYNLQDIRRIVRYAESRGYIRSEDVPDAETWNEVKPALDDEDEVRSNPLSPERGEQIMDWLYDRPRFGRARALWVLMWAYPLRVSAVRALDKDHVVINEPDDWCEETEFRPHLHLQDRPSLGPEDHEGLPLKNDVDGLGERLVPLTDEKHINLLWQYREQGSPTGAVKSRKEHADTDRYGLRGFLTSQQQPRMSGSSIRVRCHWLTCPTTTGDECLCEGCKEYRRDNDGENPCPSECESVCNESRSPHQVRHGAITKELDKNPVEVVSEIAGTSTDTIKKVYDRSDKYRKFGRLCDTMQIKI